MRIERTSADPKAYIDEFANISMQTGKIFKNPQGDKIEDTGTSRACMMVSPSGFSISVSQHIRKEDE